MMEAFFRYPIPGKEKFILGQPIIFQGQAILQWRDRMAKGGNEDGNLKMDFMVIRPLFSRDRPSCSRETGWQKIQMTMEALKWTFGDQPLIFQEQAILQ
ncbi:MAG: hypothetical protein NC115_09780 [Bacteroidales bacterium]|nr:hypothetical protein [Bacteroidales bacterium]